MQIISLTWGILAVLGMIVGFFPCLGAFNWLNIPFSGVGVIVSGVALANAREDEKNSCIAGMICCVTALFFGIIRLVIGGGVV